MGKAEENKLQKKESLLNTAFNLFTTKGLHNTSISDIVEQAGVAKGTFYLYFKDKYDINNKLVTHKATRLFEEALNNMKEENIDGYREKIIFMINHIIDSLSNDKVLLMFISKNLGLGFTRYAMESDAITEKAPFKEATEQLLIDINDDITEPRLMMYMIIELVGSSIYSSILYEQPVSIDVLKPHLYKTVNGIIDQFEIN